MCEFVAMQLGGGYTIEEQSKLKTRHGGIQVDVTPCLTGALRFMSNGVSLDISKSVSRPG
jgi:hypothetical protein